MKKKIAISTVLVVCSLMLSCLFSGCLFNQKPDYRRYFKRNFDIDLPSDVQLTYYLSDIGVQGDGSVYIVLQFNEEPSEVLNQLHFYTNRYAISDEAEREEFRHNFQARLERIFSVSGWKMIDVPEQYRPDWDSDFLFAGDLSAGVNGCEGTSFYYNIEDKLMLTWSCKT